MFDATQSDKLTLETKEIQTETSRCISTLHTQCVHRVLGLKTAKLTIEDIKFINQSFQQTLEILQLIEKMSKILPAYTVSDDDRRRLKIIMECLITMNSLLKPDEQPSQASVAQLFRQIGSLGQLLDLYEQPLERVNSSPSCRP